MATTQRDTKGSKLTHAEMDANWDLVDANTTHISSDGTDHANVVLNDTHRASDGKNHSDVVLNNTHRTSDGSDHSYIDQDVTSGSSPTLDGANITGLSLSSLAADLKTRVTNASVSTSYAIDHDNGNVFELTMTGTTTFTDSNLPTSTATKDFIVVLDGNYVPTFPVYWEATPASDSYDGTVRNLIIVSVINGTGSSEDVIYQIENLST